SQVKMVWILILLLPLVICEKERESDGAAARILRHQGTGQDSHHADHQAVLGSRKTADEFDEMPVEESKKRLEVLARKMDANGDGFVDEPELTSWVERSMVSLDNEEVTERLTEMDTDGDKMVSWEEYLADSFPDRDIKNLDADDKKLMNEDELYFKAADLDGDGKLNMEELSAFLNPENYKHMHKTLVEITMSEKDLNKDGAIDLKEFLGEMADNDHSEWHAVESNRHVFIGFETCEGSKVVAFQALSSFEVRTTHDSLCFLFSNSLIFTGRIIVSYLFRILCRFMTEYDSDGDGVLRDEEVRRWMIPDVKAIAKQEATHLINGADVDKDGKLSFIEIVDAHQLFVGSEATNYGEELRKVSHTEL
ncbi:hypothetical protein Angca_004955, partial [Angiostrongylus cantonensis]